VWAETMGVTCRVEVELGYKAEMCTINLHPCLLFGLRALFDPESRGAPQGARKGFGFALSCQLLVLVSVLFF
jgi:hypothetical protein